MGLMDLDTMDLDAMAIVFNLATRSKDATSRFVMCCVRTLRGYFRDPLLQHFFAVFLDI